MANLVHVQQMMYVFVNLDSMVNYVLEIHVVMEYLIQESSVMMEILKMVMDVLQHVSENL